MVEALGFNGDRKLLCLSAKPLDDSLLYVLRAGGWIVSVVPDIAGVRAENEGGLSRVGLAFFTAPEQASLASELLGVGGQTLWVTVASRDASERAAVRRFIATRCQDYHTLPLDPQHLLLGLGHAYGMARLLEGEEGPVERVQPIIGTSRAITALNHHLSKVASVDVPVIITGETGAGKEHLAQIIHQRSSRREGPFIAVNCAELPPTLIHAELFGFEKGAFSGANKRKVGYFEAARNGTIFLDEIGDLPRDLQITLLRFLQEKMIRRVGSVADIKVDTRVIAATHVNLVTAIKAGEFREDLYHRLNVLPLHVPALRDRGGDVDLLAEFFLAQFLRTAPNTVARGFSRAALSALRRYRWPGNVRELKNRIQRALVMCDGRLITPADLGLGESDDLAPSQSLDVARARAEREALCRAVHQAPSLTEAAKVLGVSRATLYRLLEKYDLPARCRDRAGQPIDRSAYPPDSSAGGLPVAHLS